MRILIITVAAAFAFSTPAFAQVTAAGEAPDRVVVAGADPCKDQTISYPSAIEEAKAKLFCKVRENCSAPREPGYACAVAFWKSTRITRASNNDQIIRLAVTDVDPETFSVSVMQKDGSIATLDAADFLESDFAPGCRVRMYQVLGREENRKLRQIADAEFRLDAKLTGVPARFQCG